MDALSTSLSKPEKVSLAILVVRLFVQLQGAELNSLQEHASFSAEKKATPQEEKQVLEAFHFAVANFKDAFQTKRKELLTAWTTLQVLRIELVAIFEPSQLKLEKIDAEFF